MFDYRVLATLSEATDRTLRMSTLAFIADGSLPRLSQVVTRLETLGWIQRTPDPTDGRYTLALLTQSGWAKVVDTAPGHLEAARRLVIDPLSTTQIRQLNTISRRIGNAIDEEASRRPPGAPIAPIRQ